VPHEITTEGMQLLARIAGLPIPSEDSERLVEAFGNYLELVAGFASLELDDVEPAFTYDPRWR
jgi:hypothetical protein